MKTLTIHVVICSVMTALISSMLRLYFDSLASVPLVDYIAYTGLWLLGLTFVVATGRGQHHENHQVSLAFRELVSRDEDSQDHVNRVNSSLTLFITGCLCLLTSLAGYFWGWW